MGTRYSASVQTVPGAYPASYTLGICSFPGVKRPWRGVDHPPPSSAEVTERLELYLFPPFGLSWPVIGGILTLPLHSAIFSRGVFVIRRFTELFCNPELMLMLGLE